MPEDEFIGDSFQPFLFGVWHWLPHMPRHCENTLRGIVKCRADSTTAAIIALRQMKLFEISSNFCTTAGSYLNQEVYATLVYRYKVSRTYRSKMTRFQMIRGIPFPNVPWFRKQNIEKTMDYVPKNGDIIITSYPKTGTNWLPYIVLQIMSKGESFPSFNDCVYNKVPVMEMTGPEAINNMKGLR
ncbi:hypothetical protein AVEN_250695-1, partial [Araneus ventricosus]